MFFISNYLKECTRVYMDSNLIDMHWKIFDFYDFMIFFIFVFTFRHNITTHFAVTCLFYNLHFSYGFILSTKVCSSFSSKKSVV